MTFEELSAEVERHNTHPQVRFTCTRREDAFGIVIRRVDSHRRDLPGPVCSEQLIDGFVLNSLLTPGPLVDTVVRQLTHSGLRFAEEAS